MFLFFGCEKDSINKSEITEFNNKWDLEQIKASGTLRALMLYSGTTYYLYKGRPMGYEFELLERLAKYLDVSLEIIVVKNLNELFEKWANTHQSILEVSNEPLVSKDIVGNKHSCVIDAELTSVIGYMIKVVGWYDNEMGYSNRLLDAAQKLKTH